jgi:hypothetical protein
VTRWEDNKEEHSRDRSRYRYILAGFGCQVSISLIASDPRIILSIKRGEIDTEALT